MAGPLPIHNALSADLPPAGCCANKMHVQRHRVGRASPHWRLACSSRCSRSRRCEPAGSLAAQDTPPLHLWARNLRNPRPQPRPRCWASAIAWRRSAAHHMRSYVGRPQRCRSRGGKPAGESAAKGWSHPPLVLASLLCVCSPLRHLQCTAGVKTDCHSHSVDDSTTPACRRAAPTRLQSSPVNGRPPEANALRPQRHHRPGIGAGPPNEGGKPPGPPPGCIGPAGPAIM